MNGWRGPYPQRPCACVVVVLTPARAVVVALAEVPHMYAPEVFWSEAVADWFTSGLVTWSYQPSESSYAMITAVLCHSWLFCRALTTVTIQFCSSMGSE